MKFSNVFQIIKPEYVYLRLKPNNSIRNQNTHKLARAIATLYRGVHQNIKREEQKLIRAFGKRFVIGTKYSYQAPGKVGYYIYLEKKNVSFYFIIPRHHAAFLREKISDAWANITIEEVSELPMFSPSATKYQLVYEKEDALSLAVDRRNNDLLNSNLNVIDILEEGDKLGIFYNFLPTIQSTWRHTYRYTIDKVKRGLPADRDKFGWTYVLKLTLSVIDLIIREIGEALGGKKKNEETNLIESLVDRLNGGRTISEATAKKANATVLESQIVILSESADKLRENNNARGLAQSFDTVSEANKLMYKPFRRTFKFTDYSVRAERNKFGDEEAQNFLCMAGRDVLERYNFIEKVETQETEVPEDLRSGVMCIGTNVYRGAEQGAYLSMDFEYRNLPLILLGPQRAGKSTLLGNLGVDAVKAGECFVVFDFIKNCELSSEIAGLFPTDKVLTIECGDFTKLQGLGYNEIGRSADPLQQYDNAKRSATQLQTLVDSIVTNDAPLTPKMRRYLQSASLVVFINGGSIRDVFEVLQDHEFRYKAIDRIPQSQQENLRKYVNSLAEIDELDKKGVVYGTKYTLIAGIIDRMNELESNTYLELMLDRDSVKNIDLTKEIQKNQLICIRMPEHAYPTDGERDVICTYWMTKLWLALQLRGHRIPDREKLTKVNVVIDELYQVKTTERFLSEKLSRLAKFGMKPLISAHYINQISGIRNELRSANASYMLISGCDKKNYEELKSELYPYREEDLLRLPRYHCLNLIKHNNGYARFITKLPKPIVQMREVTELSQRA